MDNDFKARAKKSISDYATRPDQEVWDETVDQAKALANRIPSVLQGSPEIPPVDKMAPIGVSPDNVRIEERLSHTLGDYRKMKQDLAQDPSRMGQLDQDYGSYKQQMPNLDLEAREAALRNLINKHSSSMKPKK